MMIAVTIAENLASALSMTPGVDVFAEAMSPKGVGDTYLTLSATTVTPESADQCELGLETASVQLRVHAPSPLSGKSTSDAAVQAILAMAGTSPLKSIVRDNGPIVLHVDPGVAIVTNFTVFYQI